MSVLRLKPHKPTPVCKLCRPFNAFAPSAK